MSKLKSLKLANQKSTVQELDELCREIVRLRDRGKCRKCGSGKQFQVAHIFSRSRRSVRFDLDNLIGLCFRHHFYWAHRSPIEFTEWTRKEVGEKEFADLRMRAYGVSKVDLSAVKIYLLNERNKYAKDKKEG